MRRAALLPLVVACSLAAHGPLRAQPPDVAVLALYGGADREQRLVRGARAEREINLYSSLTLQDLTAEATSTPPGRRRSRRPGIAGAETEPTRRRQ